MKLNQVPNLRVEDFPTEQKWISKLFVQINPFIQSLSQIFDQNIDYFTNIKSVTKEFSLENFQTFSFLWPFELSPPNDLRIIKSTKGSQQDPVILFPAWKYNAETASITITNILEITLNGNFSLAGSYRFTIRASI